MYVASRSEIVQSSDDSLRSDPGLPLNQRRVRDITLCNYDKNSNATRVRSLKLLAAKDLPKTAVDGWFLDTPWVTPKNYVSGGHVLHNTPLTCWKKEQFARQRSLSLINRTNMPVTAATGWKTGVHTANKKWNMISKNNCATPRYYGAARWR